MCVAKEQQRVEKYGNGAAPENSGMCGNGTAEISEARQRQGHAMYSKGMAKQRKEWKSSAQKCKGAVQRSLVEWREATVLQGYVMRGTVMFSSENQWHLDESKRDGLAWSRAAKAL